MKKLKSELIGYGMSFVSFVFPKLKNVREIVLFGSVTRGEAGKDSDVDLFFDVEEKKEKEIKKLVEREIEKFYKSKIAEVWFLKGVKNPIKVNVGKLEKWKLKRSIISDGIILYSKYKEAPKNLKPFVFFNIAPIKNITKRNKIIRKLFGRKEKDYSSKGVVEEFDGKKLSPSSFIIPSQNLHDVRNFLRKEKIDFVFFELWRD